jgi:hypothetical protein
METGRGEGFLDRSTIYLIYRFNYLNIALFSRRYYLNKISIALIEKPPLAMMDLQSLELSIILPSGFRGIDCAKSAIRN